MASRKQHPFHVANCTVAAFRRREPHTTQHNVVGGSRAIERVGSTSQAGRET
jgi:hypothetical protein